MLLLLIVSAVLALLPLMWVETSFDKELKRKAEEGDMVSQFDLGLCYQSGSGVRKDEKQAALWFMRAAAQGHAEAKAILGMLGR